MGTLIIIAAWMAFATAMYLAGYIYDCAIKGCRLDAIHVIRVIALAVVLMAITSALAATYPRRVRYVASADVSGYTNSSNQQPGLDSASD